MKLLDAQGRLWGRWNVVDAAAILALIIGVAVVGGGYYLVRKTGPFPRQELGHSWVPVEVEVAPVTAELAGRIKAGDEERNAAGQPVARIYRVGALRPRRVNVQVSGSQQTQVELKDSNALQLDMEINMQVSDAGLFFKDRKIRVGSPVEFRTGTYAFVGTVRNVLNAKRWVTAIIRANSVQPEQAILIREGDEGYEASGARIARIVRVLRNDPARKLMTGEGYRYLNLNEFAEERDVVLEVELLCEERETGLVFHNNPLRIGSQVVLNTTTYELNSVVTEIRNRDGRDAVAIPRAQRQWVLVDVQFTGLPPTLIGLIQSGNQQLDIDRQPMATVVEVLQVQPRIRRRNAFATQSVTLWTADEVLTHDVWIRFAVATDMNREARFFRGEPLKVNGVFLFSTTAYDLRGVVTSLGDTVPADQLPALMVHRAPKRQEVLVTIRCTGVMDEVVKRLHAGDQAMSIHGQALQLQDVVEVVPAPEAEDPNARHVVVRVRADASVYGNELVAGMNVLKVGYPLVFETPTYWLGGTIINLQPLAAPAEGS